MITVHQIIEKPQRGGHPLVLLVQRFTRPILLVQRLASWYFSALAASVSRFRITCSGSIPWVTLYVYWQCNGFYAFPGSGLFVKKSELYRCALHLAVWHNNLAIRFRSVSPKLKRQSMFSHNIMCSLSFCKFISIIFLSFKYKVNLFSSL